MLFFHGVVCGLCEKAGAGPGPSQAAGQGWGAASREHEAGLCRALSQEAVANSYSL